MHIDIANLNKSYNGNHVLKNINLDIDSGAFITLLGPSGCGKTTTLRCIAGLETPDEGTIRVNGTTFVDSAKHQSLPPHKRNVGVVFQSYALWPHMSVADNVAYPLKRQKVATAQRKQQVAATLESVGMGQHANRYPHELSGGQQQRVALARGLVSAGGVMLFDEPLSNLDAKLRIAMRTEIRRLHREFDNTSIYVTHDQDEALALSDQVILMRDGQIEQMGPPAEIYAHPASAFAADFLGFENILECLEVEEQPHQRIAHLSGGLRLVITDDISTIHPGGFIAFRAAAVTIGATTDESGLHGTGLVRDGAFTAETRTTIVDVARDVGISMRIPEDDSPSMYNRGTTKLSFHVAPDALVLLDR